MAIHTRDGFAPIDRHEKDAAVPAAELLPVEISDQRKSTRAEILGDDDLTQDEIPQAEIATHVQGSETFNTAKQARQFMRFPEAKKK